MDVGHVAPELALVVGAVIVVLTASFAPAGRQGVTTPIALAAVAVSAVSTVVLSTGAEQQISFHGTWALDGVTQGAELIIAGVTAVALLAGWGWFRTDTRRGEQPAVVLFSAAGAMVLAGAADTAELVVGMLLTSVTGYTLAAYHRGSSAAVEAGMKYFLVGAFTNAVLLVGVVLLYGVAGTTSLAGTAAAIETGTGQAAVTAAVVCLVVGLGFEIGAVPAHVWVPDVAQGSPVPSAAFLTVAPKVGAVVALARVADVLPDDVAGWRPMIALVAAATMTLGNVAALWQDDLRRLLGWSSVSQAGYALMAVVAIGRTDLAVPALIMFLAGYAAANVAAFAVVAELRGRTALRSYQGLGSTRPWLAAALVVSLLSLVGVPPLGGFVGKLTVFTATIDSGYGWLAALAAANTVVSLFYYLRAIAAMYFDDAPARPVAVLGRTAALGAGLAGAAVIAIGIAAEPLLDALEGARLLP